MRVLARTRKRALSAIIDYTIVFAFSITYIVLFGHENKEGSYSVEGVKGVPLLLFWFIYFPLLEAATGRTLGKKLLGIHVTRMDSNDISIRDAFVRHIFDPIDLCFGGLVALLTIKNTDSKQRIGDLIAKTIVVVEGHSAVCQNCKVELELNQQEMAAGRFICPKCKQENVVNANTI